MTAAAAAAAEASTRAVLGDIGNWFGLQRQGTYKSSKNKGGPPVLPKPPKALIKEALLLSNNNLDESKLNKIKDDLSLPKGSVVIDIDKDDRKDPQLCSDIVVPIYRYLQGLERELSIPSHFLKGSVITPKMRSVLVDWLIEVHSQFTLAQETLYMTVSLIDRFLSLRGGGGGLHVKRKQLQLVGVAAMFTASKFEEVFPPEIGDFVYITDNTYNSEEIRNMERSILQTLDFRLGRPLPIHFLRRWSKAGEVDILQHMMAKYFLEAALIDYELAHELPSMLAAAALALATKLLVRSSSSSARYWSQTQRLCSGYSLSDFKPLIRKLAAFISKIDESKYLAPVKKFSSSKYNKVSKMPQLKSQLIKRISEGYFI